MAELEDIVAQITDEGVRSQVKAGIDALTRQMRFGLVFERHLPESIRAYNAPIRVGDTVQLRAEVVGGDDYAVRKLVRRRATIASASGSGAGEREVALRELVAVKRFGEPVYPALKPVGSLRRSDARPSHSVVCGENFHALQLLRYLYRGQVDCIYIDPPYNTGSSDWKYNNRYVDGSDRWRHSKWLSFMEKRLKVAKDLLKSNGVLIVTIDEHEIHHLGVLLEQIFPGYLLHTVSIVINPKGTGKLNFSRVNEYVLFCVPDVGENIIEGLPTAEADAMVGLRTPEHQKQDDYSDEFGDESGAEDNEDTTGDKLDAEAREWHLPFPVEEQDAWELRHARRRGGESSYRHQRPNQFYPLYINASSGTVVAAGDTLPLDEVPSFATVDGLVPVWPLDKEGNERCWRLIPSSMQTLIDAGRVVLGQQSNDGLSWTINIWVRKTERKKYKTVWWNKQHDAGTHGTSLLHKFLERRDAFPFPKSLYAVRDTLLTVVRDRPNALILDFFAGSGTTLHATALINEMDGGARRCILVSNNEVDPKTTAQLVKQGRLPGDPAFEKHGIFWQATKPRIEAALTGSAPSGKPVVGRYVGGRPFAAGFEENAEFFELVYLDKDEVRDGAQFESIEPSLWLMAGGVGRRPNSNPDDAFVIATESNYAVLFQRSAFAQLKRALSKNLMVNHVFLVTDSESAYNQMRAQLPDDIYSSMLYRDYLGNFKINTLEAWG